MANKSAAVHTRRLSNTATTVHLSYPSHSQEPMLTPLSIMRIHSR